MPMTQDELRAALRQINDTLPPGAAPDRLSGVQRRVRRHRRNTVAAVAAGVVVLLLAVPLVRSLPDRLGRDARPVTPAQVTATDAALKYATFVAWWQGAVLGVKPLDGYDSGVDGVEITATNPPFMCAVARPGAGQPAGSQAAWALGSGSVFADGSYGGAQYGVSDVYLLWEPGVTGCDPRPQGTVLAAAPADTTGLVAWSLLFAQRPDDPSRPALDVESVYAAVPPDRLTQHGRDVYAAYEKAKPTDFGSTTEQLDRVLTAIGTWVGISLGRRTLTQASPVAGPAVLTGDDYTGTAQLPEGYTARWDTAKATFCVDGSIGGSGGSGVRHIADTSFTEPGTPPTLADGPCA